MGEAKPWTVFGKVLKELRTQRKLSQAKLAEKARLDQRTVSLLERGESQPTLPTLYRLSTALEVSLMELIGRVDRSAK